MEEGDVLTVPKYLMHGLTNPGTDVAVAYVVRGGDAPAAPRWLGSVERSAAAQ